MVPGFDAEALTVLGKLIGRLERLHLEAAVPEVFDPTDLLDISEQGFFCVEGLADFWEHSTSVDFPQRLVDLLIGAHNQRQADVTLVIRGTPRQLGLYLSLGSSEATRTLLEGMFPGIRLTPVETATLAALLRSHFLIRGVITGVPSRKVFGVEASTEQRESRQQLAGKQEQAQLERVIRGMSAATWAYVVQAHPRPRQKVIEDRMKTIDLLTQVTTRSHVQWQSTRQENQQVTSIESGGKTQTYSGDMINYRAQYLIRLLERELERQDQAVAAGQWIVRAAFGASSLDEAQRLASLLLGTLGGADSRPEPLRASLCRPQGDSLEAFHTFLTSQEVATLIQLPREEVPGYAIHDHVRFDVDFRAPASMTLPLGAIQHNGRDTENTFNVSLDALTKHVVVIGVTGSGKTTTVMNLLDRMVEAGKPFLVIEPAKTEYRALHSALPSRAKLRVYTLGNEMVAPFRLNPFEFETDDEPGSVSVLMHIDFLKAAFNAAFPLYAPLPQVLETSLHEIYEDRGWDVTSGTNRRLSDWSERARYPIFPTLTDLYNKVEEVTNRLRYDADADSNIKAALKARIGSLRIGSKGLMLDTARGISMQQLLSLPTILELENIGSDEEKTFLMGLFLARLYEFRRLQAANGTQVSGLQHLIVFEEAHRLLKNTENTSTKSDPDSSDMRAQAIEVFTNMLSEIRAYGQGVLVAEQIPSKLAPDVLKNTNLKIVHRLIAQDDRQSVGQTMNLSQQQQAYLGTLTPGMAAVYAEGADHAYLVRMRDYKRGISPLTDEQLKRVSREYASVKPFQAIVDLDRYMVPLAPMGGPDPALYHAAGKLLDSEKSAWLWSSILLRLIAAPSTVYDMLTRFSEQIEAEMPYWSAEQHEALLHMMLVRGCSEILHKRGARLGWSYAQVEALRVQLTQGLVDGVQAYRALTRAVGDGLQEEVQEQFFALAREAGDALADFVESYLPLLQRRQGPFVGCVHCQARCLYRAEVSSLLSERNWQWIEQEVSRETETTMEEQEEAVKHAATTIAQSWLGRMQDHEAKHSLPGLAYCVALHAFARAGFSEYVQALMSDTLKESLFPVVAAME